MALIKGIIINEEPHWTGYVQKNNFPLIRLSDQELSTEKAPKICWMHKASGGKRHWKGCGAEIPWGKHRLWNPALPSQTAAERFCITLNKPRSQ